MSTRRGGGKGSHGSLSKAGKTRDLNKIHATKDEHGRATHHNKPHKIPRLRNKQNYHRRVKLVEIYGRDACKDPRKKRRRKR